MDRDELEEISTRFEAVKVGMRHTKDGIILQLAVHPNDLPVDMVRDLIGQRYLTVLVRLDQEDQPTASPQVQEGNKAVKVAATLCKDEEFQVWMVSTGLAEGNSEEEVAEGLRKYLGVSSRKELKVNHDARKKLLDLRAEFIESFRR